MTDERIKYLKNWRLKNRKRLNEYQRNYYSANRTRWEKYRNYPPSWKKFGNENSKGAVGRKYELLALSILKDSIDMNLTNFQGKWDIEWNGMKIDVKMRKLDKHAGYHFKTSKNPKATHYLVFCVDNDDKIYKLFLIPATKWTGKNTLSIHIYPNNPKWDKYLLVLPQA